MLKIYLGNMEKAIYHPPTYFDNQYEDEWITKELSIRMIKEVDKSDVINSSLIQSRDYEEKSVNMIFYDKNGR